MHKGESPLRFIAVRNTISYLSLLSGLMSFYFAVLGHVHLMASAWIVSDIADMFDGQFANLFRGTDSDKTFGIELDSFIDALAFGGFPIAGLFLLDYPSASASPFWFLGCALFYLLAIVTRLSHYNMRALQGQKAFLGLPSTEAVLLLATALLFPQSLGFMPVILLVLGIAMVAPIPIPRPRGFGLFVLVLWPVLVLVFHLYLHIAGESCVKR